MFVINSTKENAVNVVDAVLCQCCENERADKCKNCIYAGQDKCKAKAVVDAITENKNPLCEVKEEKPLCDTFRVIVAGGREFNDYELLLKTLDKLFAKTDKRIIIVSGKARGADSLGERYANERGYEIAEYPADWDKYGKSAGMRRNEQMAENADALVAFWDGKSKGTANMIKTAEEHGLNIRVKKYTSH